MRLQILLSQQLSDSYEQMSYKQRTNLFVEPCTSYHANTRPFPLGGRRDRFLGSRLLWFRLHHISFWSDRRFTGDVWSDESLCLWSRIAVINFKCTGNCDPNPKFGSTNQKPPACLLF